MLASSRAERAASLLAQTEVFRNLDREALCLLAEQSTTRSYRKGQLIFHEGEPAECLFVVSEGLVKLTRVSALGHQLLLAIRRPLEIFGEVGLFEGNLRPASAEAVRPTTVLAVTRRAFLDVLKNHPCLLESLLGSLGRLLRIAIERGSDFVFLDLEARVAKVLLDLAECEVQLGEKLVDLHLTQGELAAMAGGSRPAVNKILRGFEQRGYLELEGHTILLKHPALLRRRASR